VYKEERAIELCETVTMVSERSRVCFGWEGGRLLIALSFRTHPLIRAKQQGEEEKEHKEIGTRKEIVKRNDFQ
jgi:hypothetical protein